MPPIDRKPDCREELESPVVRRAEPAEHEGSEAGPGAEDGGHCLCCDSRQQGPSITSGSYRYAQCPRCKAAALAPLPTATAAADGYHQGYFDAAEDGGYADYAGDERLHRWNARKRLAILSRCKAGSALLEVGCALGFFLDEARNAGYEVSGVDVSPWVREQTSNRLGVRIESQVSAFEPESFDVACCFQVLEHIPRCDLALAEMHQRLLPGGLLVIETWDRTSAVARLFGKHWQQITPPSVVHLFSRAGIGRLLERQGFEQLHYLRTMKWTSIGFITGLLDWKRRGAGTVGKPQLASSHIAAIPLPYFFGDLVTVVARKTMLAKSA